LKPLVAYARALAALRVAIGAALCAAPGIASPWTGEGAGSRGVRMLTRSLGARDAALGIGVLASRDGALRQWLVLSSVCDLADFAATFAGTRSRVRPLVLASSAGAAATGLAAAVAAG